MTPEKLNEWFDRFRFYRHPPSREDIANWLDRFVGEDKVIACKLLDGVHLLSEIEIQLGYREALESIPDWHRVRSRRKGKWLIAGFGGQGESGAEMLRKFREANRLSAAAHDYLFCSPSDLPSQQLSENDTVIFVDDFSGTGDQIAGLWQRHIELASGAKSFLVLTAATSSAINRLLDMDYLDELLVSHVLEDASNIFSQASDFLSDEEKARILPYCVRADKINPRGFGGCGLLFVLSHKTPNNSLPILHANKRDWVGLFPRYLNV